MKKEYSLDNIFAAGSSWPAIDANSLFLPNILQRLLSNPLELKMSHRGASGTITTSIEDIRERCVKGGGHLILEKDLTGDYIYLWKDSYITIDYNKKANSVILGGYHLDPRVGELIQEIEKDCTTKTKKNLVFSIVQTQSGLEARSMGDGSSPLIEDNYNPEVLTDIEYVIDAFKKTPPPGRIFILNGEPGTGKTHLIRSMLTQLDCIFLIVPSNLIDSMDKPNFMPLLMRVRDEHEKPIIMVIEDGDTCLVPRKSDNISAIAALLNLSDGILGSIMDIRMIISTNANIKDVDEAISRPGRLVKQTYVGPLPYEKANKRYQQLMKDETVSLDKSQKEYVLAQIYSIVNNKDAPVTFTPAPKRVIGFSSRINDDLLTVNKK